MSLIEGESLSQIGFEPQIDDRSTSEISSGESTDISLSELETSRPAAPDKPVSIEPQELFDAAHKARAAPQEGPQEPQHEEPKRQQWRSLSSVPSEEIGRLGKGEEPPQEGVPSAADILSSIDDPFSKAGPLDMDSPFGDLDLPEHVQTSVPEEEDRPSEDSMIPVDVESQMPPAPENPEERGHFSWAPAPPKGGGAIALPPDIASVPPEQVEVATLPEKLMDNLRGALISLSAFDEKKELIFPAAVQASLAADGTILAGDAEIGKYFPDANPPHARVYFHKIGWEKRDEQGWQKKSADRVLKVFQASPMSAFQSQPKFKFLAVSEGTVVFAYADAEDSKAIESISLPRVMKR